MGLRRWRAAQFEADVLQEAARFTNYVRADRVMAIDALLDQGEDWSERVREIAERL
jgi:hypothetical protein